MNHEWYYTLDGAQYGPVDEAEIIRLIQEREVPSGVPVYKEGGEEWLPAREHACFQVEVYPVKNRPVPVGPLVADASHGAAPTVHPVHPPIASASNSKPGVGTNVLGVATLVASILCACLFFYYYKQSGELEEIKTAKNKAELNSKAYMSQIDDLNSKLTNSDDNVRKITDDLENNAQNVVDANAAKALAVQAKVKAEGDYAQAKNQLDILGPKADKLDLYEKITFKNQPVDTDTIQNYLDMLEARMAKSNPKKTKPNSTLWKPKIDDMKAALNRALEGIGS